MSLRIPVIATLLAVCCFATGAMCGPLARIYICPGDMVLRGGMTQQFEVRGLDADGNESPVEGPVAWSANAAAGSITSTGLFTAGFSTGMFKDGVSASVPGGLSAVGVIEVAARAPSGGYAFERAWGNLAAGHLNCPKGIAIGPAGTVYVNDLFSGRIQAFDSFGQYQTMWSLLGSGSNSHYEWRSEGMTTDTAGNLYEANGSFCCIEVFSPSGLSLRSIGSYGTGDGQFTGPTDVAVDSEGSVYVVETQRRLVQKFDSAGGFVLKWGSEGTGPDQFSAPNSIAVGDGLVYVTDCADNSVKVFTTSGSFIEEWAPPGPFEFDWPFCVRVGPSGHVYVLDNSADGKRVREFAPQGAQVVTWTTYLRAVNGMASTGHLAVDASGCVYVVDYNANTVQKFSAVGALLAGWGQQSEQAGRLNSPQDVKLDSAGNTYVLDYGSCSVSKYDPGRNLIRRWGSYGTDEGQLEAPAGLALGADGAVYVLDAYRVVRFSSSGDYLGEWGCLDDAEGCFQQPWSIAADGSGNVYVVDVIRNCVMRFDADGLFLNEWGPSGIGEAVLQAPESIAVDSAGLVYVTDWAARRIKVYNPQGYLLGMTPESDAAANCTSLFVDQAGVIYVGGIGRVSLFDASGDLLRTVGALGSDAGELRIAAGLAVDSSGSIYIADAVNCRVVTFRRQLPESSTGALKMLPDGTFVSIAGQVVTAGSSDLGDCFYISAPDRSAGIRVTGKSASRGRFVSVDGLMTTVNGERAIRASYVSSGDSASVLPLGIAPASVGGGQLGLQSGLKCRERSGGLRPMAGLNNVGLLVQTWGDVVVADPATQTFMVSDGSGVEVKCKAPSWVNLPGEGSHVCVTGVNSTEMVAGDLLPLIRTRSDLDIVTVGTE